MDYPFTAIVGQEAMRLALLLTAIDPRIGGVLIRGEKGTAKSTMARSLAGVLPQVRVVRDCPYGCDPDDPAEQDDAHRGVPDLPVVTRPMRVITLPMNATEDRVAGTLDVRAALTHGTYRFEPGLLAAAHRGILYIDEVNLLPDHIVDLILDAAASGRNTVERDGVSVTHPARFVLIGTMNPEEGDLRPQLLDRFGLCVDVVGIQDTAARVEVMRRRMAFELDPAAFIDAWRPAEAALRDRVARARALLPHVQASNEIVHAIAALAVELGVDGHRADLVILRAATALAAFEGRQEVTRDDVRRAAELALPHRMRRRPFAQERFSRERLEEALERGQSAAGSQRSGDGATTTAGGDAGASPPPDEQPKSAEATSPPADPRLPTALPLPKLELGRDRTPRGGSGRRQRTPSADDRGRFVRAAPPTGPAADIALPATVRAAATRHARSDPSDPTQITPPPAFHRPLAIRPEDVRVKMRERMVGASIVFIVDASGSMGARRRMEAAKGAALTLLTEAYQRRDRVALIAFRGTSAEVLLPLTDSVELVQRRLAELPTGGRTPLAAGLQAGLDLIRQIRLKDPRAICIPVLLTDGKANAGVDGGSPVDEALQAAARFQQPGVHPLVLDTETDAVHLGLAARLAEQAGARYVRLADLTAESVAASVQLLAAESLG